MSIKTMIVKTAEVIPNENNPREDFGDVEALAASFATNAERPGEPFIPPLLVKDASVYRIVDGERRFRAMQSLGTESFTATVASSFDDANALVAMLATDDKKTLSEIERSRGVQQMLLLGVDPDIAAAAARIDSKMAHRVLAGRNRAKDKAETFTLDRLLALAEFEDESAISAITKAKEKNWRDVVDSERRRLVHEKFCDRWRKLAEKSDLPFVELDALTPGHARAYDRDDISIDQLFYPEDKILKSLPKNAVALSLFPGKYKTSWCKPCFAIWTKNNRTEVCETAQERRKRKQKEAQKEAFERDLNRRCAFLTDRAKDPANSLAHTCKAMSAHFTIDDLGWHLKSAFELIGISELPYVASVIHVACAAYMSSDLRVLDYTCDKNLWLREKGLDYLGALQGMVSDGYEPSDDERTLMTTIGEMMAEQKQRQQQEQEADDKQERDEISQTDASDNESQNTAA